MDAPDGYSDGSYGERDESSDEDRITEDDLRAAVSDAYQRGYDEGQEDAENDEWIHPTGHEFLIYTAAADD